MRSYGHGTSATSLAFLVIALLLSACTDNRQSLEVVATAYTSHAGQTDSEPDIAAWGDKLTPGMNAIAVSRDLLELGLTRGVEVEISGLSGKWIVLDKMNKRWTKKIDIYMGLDREAAKQWGKKPVVITWKAPETSG